MGHMSHMAIQALQAAKAKAAEKAAAAAAAAKKKANEEEDEFCVVCFDEVKCMILSPCSHMVLCVDCCKNIREKDNLVSLKQTGSQQPLFVRNAL